MIKTSNCHNFNKIIIRNELTDVIVIHFFRQEFSEEHNRKIFTSLGARVKVEEQPVV